MAANKLILRLRFIMVLAIHITLASLAFGQTNYLHKKISVSFSNIPLTQALEEISRTSNVKFSYNTRFVDENKKVSVHAKEQSISKVLDVLTEETLRYKVVGQHIILLKKTELPKKNQEVQFYTLSGWITDYRTQQKLGNVSVYSVGDKNAAITNSEGYYTLLLPVTAHPSTISYSKKDYFDTIIFCGEQKDQQINLSLYPEVWSKVPVQSLSHVSPMAAELAPAQIGDLKLVRRFVPNEALVNSENLRVIDHRPAQASFLPYLGSNAKLSGTVTNNVSLNCIAGFTGAVSGVEIGGVLNVTKRYINGAQLSGFGNITGDYVRGTQIAGFLNRTMGTMVGVQLAGFANNVKDTVKGIQIAGFTNITAKAVTGVQLAGFNNILKGKMGGVQIAGFNNYTTQNVDGVQLAGFMNTAKKDVEVLQVAGAINHTKGVNKGAQIAGVLNKADTVQGFQLALINISDTSSGVSLGFFNYVKKGYHAFGVSANEVFPVNLTYRTGNRKLYNIFTVGANPLDFSLLSVGAGLGTLLNSHKKLSVAFELTANRILEGDFGEDELNLLNKLDVLFRYSLAPHLTLHAGPTCNVFVTSLIDEETGGYTTNIAKGALYENISGKNRVQIWIGGNVGISF